MGEEEATSPVAFVWNKEVAKNQNYRGSSLKKSSNYNTSTNIETICANCHSLEHHPRGESEKNSCGSWQNKKTTNCLYADPNQMFVQNSKHRYTLQKKYFIRFILSNPNDYKCKSCGVSAWNNRQLVLQFNHIDGDPSNASLDNLELLCPNCHVLTSTWGGQKA